MSAPDPKYDPNDEREMREENRMIPLTQGKIALIDEDMKHLKKLKWSTHQAHKQNLFYAARGHWIKPRVYTEFLHWYVIGKPLKGFVTDHMNGDGLDNRRSNLRIVSKRKNAQNNPQYRSGRLNGTCFDKRRKKWVGNIWIDRKQIFLGYFKTEKQAHEAYLKAEGELK